MSSKSERMAVIRVHANRSSLATAILMVKEGTCKVIGREFEKDPDHYTKTQLLSKSDQPPIPEGYEGKVREFLDYHEKNEPAPMVEEKTPRSFRRTSDVVLADDGVSRMHAMVFFTGRVGGVVDLGSTNGTFVNGKRVEVFALKNGDIITVGNTSIFYDVVTDEA